MTLSMKEPQSLGSYIYRKPISGANNLEQCACADDVVVFAKKRNEDMEWSVRSQKLENKR